jgi:hypothetical protein
MVPGGHGLPKSATTRKLGTTYGDQPWFATPVFNRGEPAVVRARPAVSAGGSGT